MTETRKPGNNKFKSAKRPRSGTAIHAGDGRANARNIRRGFLPMIQLLTMDAAPVRFMIKSCSQRESYPREYLSERLKVRGSKSGSVTPEQEQRLVVAPFGQSIACAAFLAEWVIL